MSTHQVKSQQGSMSLIETSPPVVFYPTYGHLVENGRSWRVPVSGAVSHPRRIKLPDRVLIRLLQKVMKVGREEMESELFRQRANAFLARAQKAEPMVIRLGDRTHKLKRKMRRHGHFRGVFHIDARQVRRLQEEDQLQDGWLEYEVVAPGIDAPPIKGRVQLIEDRGVSVISDIDDTIKHTGVHSRRAMLVNTFLREFEPVDGMADLFRGWARQGAAFHFVSSSPCQLYRDLAALCQREGFPEASFHMRPFRLREQMLRKMLLLKRRGKARTIKSIVKAFPGRRFVLLGDSGERDPELYGAVARRYPEQIASILIRQVSTRPMHQERRERAFRCLPVDLYRIFRCCSELSDKLPQPYTGASSA